MRSVKYADNLMLLGEEATVVHGRVDYLELEEGMEWR